MPVELHSDISLWLDRGPTGNLIARAVVLHLRYRTADAVRRVGEAPPGRQLFFAPSQGRWTILMCPPPVVIRPQACGNAKRCGRAMPSRTESEVRSRTSAPYSSKIIKAGALIGDTKTLLSHWDVDASVDKNISQVQRDNVFGKTSRSRVEDILAIFRQRYLTEEPVTRALVTLVRGKFPSAAFQRLLYFHSARADRLLHDAVTEILVPMQAQGLVDVSVQDFERALAKWVDEGKTQSRWSQITITRVAQELLATLRDFGVLQGAVNKKIAPPYPLPHQDQP